MHLQQNLKCERQWFASGILFAVSPLDVLACTCCKISNVSGSGLRLASSSLWAGNATFTTIDMDCQQNDLLWCFSKQCPCQTLLGLLSFVACACASSSRRKLQRAWIAGKPHLDASFDEGLDSGDVPIGGCFMERRPPIMRCDVHICALLDEQIQNTSCPCRTMRQL